MALKDYSLLSLFHQSSTRLIILRGKKPLTSPLTYSAQTTALKPQVQALIVAVGAQ